MSSIKASFSFSSQNALSYAINLVKSFTGVADSGHSIRSKVTSVSLGGAGDVTIAKANDKTDVAYVYLCNLDPEKENYVYIYTGGTTVAKVGGGEFAFIPANPAIDLKVYGTKSGQMIEYGSFGVDDTQAKLG